MKNLKLKKGQQINAGNFIISIGAFDIREVAIISKSSGDFVKIANTGVKLKKVKRKFRTWLNSDTTFTFSFMTEERIIELIELLKK